MDSWTEVFTLLKTCTEVTAPVLSRELKDACDLAKTSGLPGGYFDGPLAWRMLMDKLKGGERSEADKDFYRTAERLQRASHLHDGCSASEYSRKALAFLVHIKPFLPQAYGDDDTTQYLIGLMPKALREGGRRIKAELATAGRSHDFMEVIRRCRALVHEEQKGAPPAPAFVLTGARSRERRRSSGHRADTGLLQLVRSPHHVDACRQRVGVERYKGSRHGTFQKHPHHHHHRRFEPQEPPGTAMAGANGRDA